MCQYYTEEYSGISDEGNGVLFMLLCTRDGFISVIFTQVTFVMLIHTFLKCIINLFAVKTTVVFSSAK